MMLRRPSKEQHVLRVFSVPEKDRFHYLIVTCQEGTGLEGWLPLLCRTAELNTPYKTCASNASLTFPIYSPPCAVTSPEPLQAGQRGKSYCREQRYSGCELKVMVVSTP